jgi:hypothetical protein
VTTARKAAVVGVAVLAIASLRFYVARRGVPFVAASRLEAGASIPHMDHAPRHGGLVLMRGDTHFEVVLSPAGNCQVYFSDATRTELPASFALEVDVGLAGINGGRQNVPFQIDPEGRMWSGRLNLIDDPHAIVRVTYVARGEQPYWIDVPLSAWSS